MMQNFYPTHTIISQIDNLQLDIFDPDFKENLSMVDRTISHLEQHYNNPQAYILFQQNYKVPLRLVDENDCRWVFEKLFPDDPSKVNAMIRYTITALKHATTTAREREGDHRYEVLSKVTSKNTQSRIEHNNAIYKINDQIREITQKNNSWWTKFIQLAPILISIAALLVSIFYR